MVQRWQAEVTLTLSWLTKRSGRKPRVESVEKIRRACLLSIIVDLLIRDKLRGRVYHCREIVLSCSLCSFFEKSASFVVTLEDIHILLKKKKLLFSIASSY